MENFVLSADKWYSIKMEFDPTTKGVIAYADGVKGQTITGVITNK